MTPDIRQLDKVEKVGRIFRLTFTDGDSINTGDSGPLHHRLDVRGQNEGSWFYLEHNEDGQLIELEPVEWRDIDPPDDCRNTVSDGICNLLHALELEQRYSTGGGPMDAEPAGLVEAVALELSELLRLGIHHYRAERAGGDDLTGPQLTRPRQNPFSDRDWTE
jgi:hypothetical protein